MAAPSTDVASLIAEIEPESVDKVRAIVRELLAMHHAALARMIELAPGSRDAFAGDEQVASVLLLHGLHPVDAESRVRAALLRVRGAELVALVDGVAIVRAQSAGDEKVIDEVVCAAAPDVEVRVERIDIPLDRLRKHARCDLCGVEIGAGHEHTIDPKTRKLDCACNACVRLFDASTPRKRVAPRAERLAEFRMSDGAWEALSLPIDVAFFYSSSVASRVVAAYPGPAGATESALALAGWSALAAENPVLGELVPDVEALLVNRRGDAREYCLVSIDRCYELVGLIRRDWRGFSGGDVVWAAVEKFFATLEVPCPS